MNERLVDLSDHERGRLLPVPGLGAVGRLPRSAPQSTGLHDDGQAVE
jgi:hypothetical protein